MPSESPSEVKNRRAEVLSGSAASEITFHHLLEKLPAGAYTCDAEGLITYFNQQAVQLWGRAPRLNDPIDRFCGSFKLYLTDGSPISHDQCWMAKALSTGRDYEGDEIIVERPNGERRTVLAHASPVRDSAGHLVGAVNVLVDITDRKRAEQAQQFLSAIIESSEDAIICKSLDGTILTWNSGAQRLFGYTAEEIVGEPIDRLIPPDKNDDENAIHDRIFRGDRVQHYETVRVSKQGRRIDVSLSVSPVLDASGQMVAISKVLRDITERKHSEAAKESLQEELTAQLDGMKKLHNMSSRLFTALELQPILDEVLQTATEIEGTDMGLLLLCDAEHNCLRVGASRGLSEGFLDTVELVELSAERYGRYFNEGERIFVEDDVETDPLLAPIREAAQRDGILAVDSTPLITRSGNFVGVLSTYFRRRRRPSDRVKHLIELCARQAVDFIESARLYAQLREADRRKDEFLAILAHELRNPLAPISNSLHLLRLSDDLSPTAATLREIMERQVDQMVRMVDDLMEISRISRGTLDLRKEETELAAVIRGAVDTSRPLIDASRHQLAITLPSEPIKLEADPFRLSQVISNLLNNSAKYTEEGGQIWLTARVEESHAVISVRDTGVGIPTNMLPRVFDMFTQVDSGIGRSQRGLGIGLTLAREIVQLHGGTLEALSEGRGKGSEFVVRLPIAAANGQSQRREQPSASGSISFPSHRVLIVDDTRAAAYVLGKLLDKMGQVVQTTHDASSALEIARRERPQLVISDITMPGMDGYELARRMRKEINEVVMVALTGHGQLADRKRSIEAGFDYHLVKPVSLESLRALLASLPSARRELPLEPDETPTLQLQAKLDFGDRRTRD